MVILRRTKRAAFEGDTVSTKMHMLEVYDADNLDGPNPIHVRGVYTVRGPESSQYYILEPTEAIRINGADVEQLAIRPHYEGDRIDKAVESVCTVGIALAKPGHTYEADHNYGFADFCFWKVGKIHPSNGDG